MIRRKDSFGYIDFIRGKYSLSNIFQIQKCIDEMSIRRKNSIITKTFDVLWKELWGINSTPIYRSEETSSSKKFEALTSMELLLTDKRITLSDIVNRSTTTWKEQEWEFPKGRRNYKENDMECAFREFEEETGMSRKHIRLVENVIPYEEYFIGSNFKAINISFIWHILQTKMLDMHNFQDTEVSKMQWMTLEGMLYSVYVLII